VSTQVLYCRLFVLSVVVYECLNVRQKARLLDFLAFSRRFVRNRFD
jgi:hypothetical protein